MPGVARLTDIGVGICVCHPVPIPMVGMLITGSTDNLTNNLPTARLLDIVLAADGHVGLMVSSSSKTFANSRGVVRIGDAFAGCFNGIIVTGSSDRISG